MKSHSIRHWTLETEPRIDYSAGYLFLKPNANTAVPSGVGEVLDYVVEKAKVDAYREAQKAARAAGTEIAEEVDANKPRKDWRLYQALNALQGDDAANNIVKAINLSPAGWRKQLHQSLAALRANGGAKVPWATSLVQLFSPHAAKGYARLKPDGTGRGDKTKDGWADPFTEWLRIRGYFAAACPFFVGSKGEHVRLLCPIPKNIEAGALMDVVAELRQAQIFGSAPKIDCMATLELARLIIRHFRERKRLLLEPDALISGIAIANYQSMGQAKSVTAIETLAVPGWFPLETEADADLWTSALEEHQAVIRRLRDNYSEEIGLILSYRRFLERRGQKALFSLLEFMGQYGIFLLRERATDPNSRRKQFQTDHLEAILNQQDEYEQIISNAGFKAVAAAIRSATVSAQAMKSAKKEYREIRYDLLPELRRKRSLPGVGPFLASVSDFIATYNAESARRLEQEKRTGIKRVTSEDMESFTQLLLKQKDASVLGAMLCAYATCRAPKAADEPEPQPVAENEGGEA
ncbi:MAG TPA: hypothetical protein VMD29_05100 [Terracidiphilus sp.]|nr:hypothetical protein [Terracidiphilus sp.]